MVRRGLTASRSEATLAIRAGRVVVGGSPAMKAATLVRADEPIALTGAPRRYVSRGGEKLEAALDRFVIDVDGVQALDVGASTGGFTDCLLSRGAAQVVAVDVGYGQLDWRLREDPRVTVLERINARELVPGSLPFTPEFVAADLSFISIRSVLPALVRSASPLAVFVLLVKPQFEAGKEEVGGGGVVRDRAVWRRVLSDVAETCRHEGLEVLSATVSPLLGPAGNVEFFLHARGAEAALKEESGPDVDAAIDEALALVGQPGHRSKREQGTGA